MSTIAVAKTNSSSRTADFSKPCHSSTGLKNRICIGIPVHVSGTDLNGQDFLERTQTETISSSGASLLLNRFLGPDQQITIRRPGSRIEATARIIGQIGIRAHGFVYGIALNHAESSFWGVHFPPGSDETNATSIRCSCCMRSEMAGLNDVETSVLQANNLLSLPCAECNAITFWQLCEMGDPAPVSTTTSKSNRRKNIRTSMKAAACLCQPTGLRDIAGLLDISRGGICFRTTHTYTVHSWVELAVPYTEGGANIFVPGRIAWERTVRNGFREYGVQYVRN
jgi:PilZ domain